MTVAGFLNPGSAFLRAVVAGLAAGLVALAAGCTAIPDSPDLAAVPASPAPAVVLPLSGPVPALAAPEIAGVMPAQSFKSRFSDFIARRLQRQSEAAVAVIADDVPVVPEPPALPVDEKYQLTGKDARELERGHASWYGGQFHGRRTASGENYDKYALTAAHKTLPFGTIVRVRSLALGREVDVRINDRGPFSPGRVIDVSQAAAQVLGLTSLGVAEVSLNVAATLGKMAPLARSGKKSPHRSARTTPSLRRP